MSDDVSVISITSCLMLVTNVGLSLRFPDVIRQDILSVTHTLDFALLRCCHDQKELVACIFSFKLFQLQFQFDFPFSHEFCFPQSP
jgi:hypothetical protein